MMFLSKWVICRFHVNLPGCNWEPPVFLIYTTLAKCTIWMGPICLWWPLTKLLLPSFIFFYYQTPRTATPMLSLFKTEVFAPRSCQFFRTKRENATNSDAKRTSVNLRLQNQLMVNWWFGAWWFGFPLPENERDWNS